MTRFDRFKVFLYYKDLESAKHFYRDILGLPEYRESDHVWQYAVTPDSFIGLVADGHGYLPASESKPVMPAIHIAKTNHIPFSSFFPVYTHNIFLSMFPKCSQK